MHVYSPRVEYLSCLIHVQRAKKRTPKATAATSPSASLVSKAAQRRSTTRSTLRTHTHDAVERQGENQVRHPRPCGASRLLHRVRVGQFPLLELSGVPALQGLRKREAHTSPRRLPHLSIFCTSQFGRRHSQHRGPASQLQIYAI